MDEPIEQVTSRLPMHNAPTAQPSTKICCRKTNSLLPICILRKRDYLHHFYVLRYFSCRTIKN